MREPALAMTAMLRSVRRGDIVHVDTVFLGLVIDVTLQFLESPLLELTGVRDALSDVRQILERDSRTIVLNGFPNDCFGDAVEVVGTPPGES